MRSKHSPDGIKDLGRHMDYMDSALVIVEGRGGFHEGVVGVAKQLLGRDRFGVYVSLNKPHFTIENLFKSRRVKRDRLYFVDCITAVAHYSLDRGHNRVIYASHPADLKPDGSIPAAVSHFIESIPGEKFVLVDALRTLFIYNEPFVVSKFIRSLLKSSKSHSVKVVVMARAGQDDDLIHLTHNLFDDVIHVD